MAGFVYVVVGSTGFLVGFVISEIIAQLSLIEREGLLMVKKESIEVMSFAKRIKSRVIASWETHLPSRQSLLMSLCKPSEKEAEIQTVPNPSFNRTANMPPFSLQPPRVAAG